MREEMTSRIGARKEISNRAKHALGLAVDPLKIVSDNKNRARSALGDEPTSTGIYHPLASFDWLQSTP
jgi:hypothetical protein